MTDPIRPARVVKHGFPAGAGDHGRNAPPKPGAPIEEMPRRDLCRVGTRRVCFLKDIQFGQKRTGTRGQPPASARTRPAKADEPGVGQPIPVGDEVAGIDIGMNLPPPVLRNYTHRANTYGFGGDLVYASALRLNGRFDEADEIEVEECAAPNGS